MLGLNENESIHAITGTMSQDKAVHFSTRGGRKKKEREGFVFGQDKRIMQEDRQQYARLCWPIPVPANMPGTHKAAHGWCKMSKSAWHTGAGLSLYPEMIDWCCLKLQSYHQFEGWQSFKNRTCVDKWCVKYCNFETMEQLHPWLLMLNSCRLGKRGPTR